jgi:DMSO/TMAO reductase YedYZ molybdopterin-dependent catalytic subunit
MASVKWLTRITAVREPFLGYWQTTDYAYWAEIDGQPARRALGEMKIKSEIARPRVYETLPPLEAYTISGAAWAGESTVSRVEVSVDQGLTWSDAEFIDPSRKYAWRRWTLKWTTPSEPGRYVVMSRATDANGEAQPDRHDPRYGTYVINHSLPIEVFIASPAAGD